MYHQKEDVKHPDQKLVEVPEYFIAGAFDGIERIILKTIESNKLWLIPLQNVDIDKDNLLQHIIPKDIKDLLINSERVTGIVPAGSIR
jgi:ATP-dependent Clp protease ATP-binding subunit ClpX